MTALSALNLFDLAPNDDDRANSRRSLAAVWWTYDRLEDLRPLLAQPPCDGSAGAQPSST